MCIFKRSGDHLDLHVLTHSFPTRRSSDLNNQAAMEAADKDLKRLKAMEETAKSKAVPAAGGNAEEAAVSRSGGRIEVKKTEKLEPGIGFTRLVKAKMAARLAGDTPLVMAQRMYGQDSEKIGRAHV